MENNPPPNQAFVSVIKSKESNSDLDKVYTCLKRYPSIDPQLSSFQDLDTIRRQIVILTDPDRKTDYLVYNTEHARAREEVCFQIAGYIAGFDLPCHGLTRRYVDRCILAAGQNLTDISDMHTNHTPSDRGSPLLPTILRTSPSASRLWTLW